MDPRREADLLLTRRSFLGRTAGGLGALALSSLLQPELLQAATRGRPGALATLSHTPTAKRVIYLFMSGGPSQLDLFDQKPRLREFHGQELPASVRMGQRITGMTSGQTTFPCVAPPFEFAQHGQSGAWVSNLLPQIAGLADQLCFIKSMHTEAINHDPAITFIQTGSQQPGRPSNGAWVSYGLGCETSDLPAYLVLISRGPSKRDPQPLFARLWGAGFLPSEHQGVKLRAGSDPVLYLQDPPGVTALARRRGLDALAQLNALAAEQVGDAEIAARIAQYEMAYRMQTVMPDLMDLGTEPASTFELYGDAARMPGTYAANCLLARRLAERGVRFIQLFHRDWDHHGNLPSDLGAMCRDTDQPTAGLIRDLAQRGLLEDTLVVWGGEFGRTVYSQGELTKDNYGRDHHGRCFTVFLTGGGIKPGLTLGETDDHGYNIVRDPVHIHDLNATILHCLGVDHTKLTYRYQGRDHRLTDVAGEVVRSILA